MADKNFLDQAGLGYLWTKITDAITNSVQITEKKIPTKNSQLENDSKFITAADIPEGVQPSTTVPKVDNGSGDIGTEVEYARGDHIHPTDQTRLAVNGGNASKTYVIFSLPKQRQQIISGETLETIAGKILKYMNDFGTCAFKSMILKEDLAPSVKSSLEKADSALQSYTESDPTVPDWAKNPTKPSYTPGEIGALSIDDAEANYAKKSDITKIYRPKGSVQSYSNLPQEGNQEGDVWNVIDTDMNYAWTIDGTWDPLGGISEIPIISNETIDEITGA